MDMIEHIRHTYGTQSRAPQPWAKDESLGSLVQHLTFGAFAAADQGYYTELNNMYLKYQIRAWNFFSHKDTTLHAHAYCFRFWRGHRYILPDAVVKFLDADFEPQGHDILGYLKAAEWMAAQGTDQVRPAYSY